MNSLKETISVIFSEAFEQQGLERRLGRVVPSQRADLGQFQCNGALAAAKAAKKNPREIAQKIVDSLEDNDAFKELSLAGPGFINIKLSEEYIGDFINSVNEDPRLGCPSAEIPQNVVIDFGSPNIAKPMHVGHLRSAIIGDCLQKLFAFQGHNVVSDNHVGDWGTQMGMLITELYRRDPSLPYFDENNDGPFPEEPPLTIADLEAMYPEASKRCKASKEDLDEAIKATDELQNGRKGYIALWKHFVNLSIKTLKDDYEKLGITFDHWYGESFYTDMMVTLVDQLQKDGHAITSEGAIVLPIAEESDKKEMPPVMLVKSGGGFLYGTSDIATIDFRMKEFNADLVLYVVDQRQHLHFEQVFRATKKTGICPENTELVHVGFGTVNGKDGKPFKTREGGVMKLTDLIQQVYEKAEERLNESAMAANYSDDEKKEISQKVGIAALKFADLMNQRLSNYVFDLDKFVSFEGKTGPYLLYTAARLKSILRKAKDLNFNGSAILAPADDIERDLYLNIASMGDVLRSTEDNLSPNYICDYVYALSKDVNRFLKDHIILKEENETLRGSWLSIVTLSLKTIEQLLTLLGIETSERM